MALFCLPVGAETLSLSGNWDYQNTDSGTEQFSQRYGADFNKQIDVTELMSVDAAMRYNRNQEADNTREDFNPSMSYVISNEIFNLNLSGNASQQRNSSRANNSNRSWAINWNSAWLATGLRPAISGNFNQTWQNDDLDPHASDSDDKSSGVSLTWGNNNQPVKVFYSFNRQENNDHAAGTSNRSDSHLADIEGTVSFWQNRGPLALSQQYAYTKNKYYSRVDQSSGTALVRISMAAYSGQVDPAANVSLSLNSGLTNNNKSDAALVVNDPADPNRMAVGIRADSQPINELYLYTDIALSPAISSQFTWDLYSSNDNTNWTLVKNNVTAPYDSASQRFEINMSGYQSNFLRVVAVNDPAATSVNFSEIEVYRVITANPAATTTSVVNDQTRWATDANLSLQVRPDLTLTSNLSYEKNEYSSGPDQRNTKVSGGLGWTPDYYLTVQLNGSLNSIAVDNSPTSQSRIYGLTLSSPLLPTVDAVLGATMSQYLEGSEKVTTGYNYNLQMNAAIYNDLDARINASYAQTDNERDNSTSNTKTTGLTLTARLIPGLTADFSGTYTKSSGQTETIATIIDAHWRLSEVLSLNSSYRQTWSSQNTNSMSFGFAWALTNNMQVSLNHNYTISPLTSHSTVMDWRWTINRYISLLTSGSYNSGPTSWAVHSRLNTRFTAM